MVGRSLLSGFVSRLLQNPDIPRLKEKRLSVADALEKVTFFVLVAVNCSSLLITNLTFVEDFW
ncbi:hypothetical protein DPMN_074940 [Dreissena polymorpha]|uniref:Uncharacterized protein n=1 Tax=Dreissena polymorpha TaxID=45954 RepID=A0A9D4BM14_DREPO|nr:hypothetical protein DPMN_074940 [Dreissena polymorpha]